MQRPYLIPAIKALRDRYQRITETINALELLAQQHVEKTVRTASLKEVCVESLSQVSRDAHRSEWLRHA